jgi:hypothetical protein
MPELPRHVPPRRPRSWWSSIRDAGFTGFVLMGAVGLVVIGLLITCAQLGLTYLAGLMGL